MAAQVVEMKPDAVRGFARQFDTFSDVLKSVAKVLEGLLMLLRTTAFIGLVGGFAVMHFIEMIKPQIEQLAEKCSEMSRDLMASAAAYERGDAQGATKFY